jgi:hypothetical protein
MHGVIFVSGRRFALHFADGWGTLSLGKAMPFRLAKQNRCGGLKAI